MQRFSVKKSVKVSTTLKVDKMVCIPYIAKGNSATKEETLKKNADKLLPASSAKRLIKNIKTITALKATITYCPNSPNRIWLLSSVQLQAETSTPKAFKTKGIKTKMQSAAKTIWATPPRIYEPFFPSLTNIKTLL